MQTEKIKRYFLAAALALCTTVQGALPITLGTWQENFTNGYQTASGRRMPILLFYGNTSCHNCNSMSEAIATQTFKDWMAAHRFVYVNKHVSWDDHLSCLQATRPQDASSFDTWMAIRWSLDKLWWVGDDIRETVQVSKLAFDLPLMRVYWQPQGCAPVSRCFSGVYGGMGAPSSCTTLESQLIWLLEDTVGYWTSVEFAVSAFPESRLEIEVDATTGFARTTYVDVPLKRDAECATGAVTTLMKAQDGRGFTYSTTVSWGVGELAKTVRLPIPADRAFVKDGMIELTLSDENERMVTARTQVFLVAPENAPANPHWIGRHDASSLPFGEWTMDLDVATNKVAQTTGEAYTIVLFSGVLWCPWCKGMDEGLLSQDVFKEFVRERKTALVLLDNPRRSPDAVPTTPNGPPPTLLRADETATGVSGLGYLTRNMIGSEEAEAVLLRNHRLGYTDRGQGGFRTPGAARVGYPTMFLLRKNGTIAGTLDYDARTVTNIVEIGGSVVTNVNKYFFDTEINMARLKALYESASNYNGGRFVTAGTKTDRLEAEETNATRRVYVPLVRDRIVQAGTNYLVATAGSVQVCDPVEVVWRPGENRRCACVDLSSVSLKAGQTVVLELLDARRALQATNFIAVVERQKPSVKNPHWVGDYSSVDLPWGEWTMDYEIAKEKAAKESGHVFALFSGVLWCPYCEGVESSLFASAAFTKWAKDNRVALVLFDQGLASSPATAAATNKARLLSYERGVEHIHNVDEVSGAAYLSRRGLDGYADEAVAASIATVTEKTSAWRTPGSSSARLSNPTMLLVRNDTVIGRFSAHRDNAKVYDVTENLGRLNDLLLLEAKQDDLDNYASTTEKTLSIGAAEAVSMQISDAVDYFRLSNVPNGYVTLAVDEKTMDRSVSFTLTCGGTNVATGTETLVASGVVASAGEWMLKVSSYGKSGLYCPDGKSTAFTASFTSEALLLPMEEPAVVAPVGGKVTMWLSEGVDYRLDGIDATSLAEHFTVKDAEAGIYTAVEDAPKAVLTANAATVAYARANTGKIAFADSASAYTVPGRAVSVDVPVNRLGGRDGRLSVSVALDGQVSTEGYGKVVLWGGTTNLVWSDGDEKAKVVRVGINQQAVFNQDVRVALRLSSEDAAAILPGGEEHVLTVVPNVRPGRLVIVGSNLPIAGTGYVCAPAGGSLELVLDRIDGIEGDVSAEVSASAGVVSGDKLAWLSRSGDTERLVTVALPTLAEQPGGKVFVTLESSDMFVEAASRRLTVELVDPSAPVPEQGELALSLVKGVAGESVRLPVCGVSAGDAIGLERTSGALPIGLDVGAETAVAPTVSVSGTARVAGTYSATYRLYVVRQGVRIDGGVFSISCAVADPTQAAAPGESAPVPSLVGWKTRTWRGLPVTGGEPCRLCGLLTVTVPSSGKVSAKYVRQGGAVALSAAGWSEAGLAGARAVATPVSGVAADWLRVDLPSAATVRLTFCVDGVEYEYELPVAEADCAPWAGTYTACLKPLDDDSGILPLSLKSNGDGAYLWRGYAPGGKSVSGVAYLTPLSGESGELPVWGNLSDGALGVDFELEAGAAARYRSGKNHHLDHRVMAAAGDVMPTVVGSGTCRCYAAYGQYLDPAEDLQQCLAESDMGNVVHFRFSDQPQPSADAAVAGQSVTACDPSSLRVTVDSETGLVGGWIVHPQYGKVQWRGVLMNGWTGCNCVTEDLPLVNGLYWGEGVGGSLSAEADEL